MAVFQYEVKKLTGSISLWGLLLIFFLFNIFLVYTTNWNLYPNFVAEIAETTGIEMDEKFNERLNQLSVDSADREMLEILQEDTVTVVDPFDTYDITEVGEAYINYLNQVNHSEFPSDLSEKMQEKYRAMQRVVEQKGMEDEALTLSHASSTRFMHENLFDTILGWLMIEGMFLTLLISLLSAGFEKGNGTEVVVFSTKTGRNLFLNKFAASLLVGLGTYLLLTTVTLVVYFTVHDYSALWHSSISNVFNYRIDLIAGPRPFVTWQSQTILTYLFSKIGISLVLMVCFILLAFIVEMLIRINYLSFVLILTLSGALVVLPMVISGGRLGFYLMLTPVWLWLKHSIWFTDGDVDILWKNFEVLGSFGSMFILIVGAALVFYQFKRRDLT